VAAGQVIVPFCNRIHRFWKNLCGRQRHWEGQAGTVRWFLCRLLFLLSTFIPDCVTEFDLANRSETELSARPKSKGFECLPRMDSQPTFRHARTRRNTSIPRTSHTAATILQASYFDFGRHRPVQLPRTARATGFPHCRLLRKLHHFSKIILHLSRASTHIQCTTAEDRYRRNNLRRCLVRRCSVLTAFVWIT